MDATVDATERATSASRADMPGRVVELSGWRGGQLTRETQRQQREVADVNKEQPANPLDNTILKIDRLYSDREAELKMRERMPVDEYADTATGRSLADLINELDERHTGLSDTQQLEAESAAAAAPREPLAIPEPQPEIEPAAEPEPVSMIEPIPALPRAETAAEREELPDLLRDFEARVLAHIEQRLRDGQRRQIFEHAQKVERIREAATLQMRKKEAALRASYRAKYQEKERELRAHYKKLIALANTVSQQKAQIQQTRKQFDEKLRAAGELYRQMEDMRGALRDRMENGNGAVVPGSVPLPKI